MHDKNKPKRSRTTPYSVFKHQYMRTLKGNTPQVQRRTREERAELVRTIRAKWKQLPQTEKDKFEGEATRNKQTYDACMKQYNEGRSCGSASGADDDLQFVATQSLDDALRQRAAGAQRDGSLIDISVDSEEENDAPPSPPRRSPPSRFAFRAETFVDVEALLKQLPAGSTVDYYKRTDSMDLPDVVVELRTTATHEEVLKATTQVVDAHVIARTLRKGRIPQREMPALKKINPVPHVEMTERV